MGPVLGSIVLEPGDGVLRCMTLCNTWGSPTACEHGNVLSGGVCELLGFTIGLPAQVVQPGVFSFTRTASYVAGAVVNDTNDYRLTSLCAFILYRELLAYKKKYIYPDQQSL